MLIPILMVLFQTEQVISNNYLNNISLIITGKHFIYNYNFYNIFYLFYKIFFYLFIINFKLKFINEISILISKKLLNKYLNGDQKYFFKKNSGELMRNVINENRKVTKSLSAAADLLIDITLLISAIILLFFC